MTEMSLDFSFFLSIFAGVVALLYSSSAQAQQPCQQLGEGGDILTRARTERRILQNLAMLEGTSWSEREVLIENLIERGSRDDEIGKQSASSLDLLEYDLLPQLALGMVHRGENYERFRLCDARGGAVRGRLERNWWGFYYGVQIPRDFPGREYIMFHGISMFYLRSSDGMEFAVPGRNPSLDYTQAISGVEFERDWFSVTLGAFTQRYPEASDVSEHLVSPSLYGDLDMGRERERSLYLNLGIPKWGLSFDLVGLPGERRGGVDVAQLGLGGVKVPGGLRLDATAGFLGQQDKFFGAFAVDDIPGGFDLEVGFEADDPYFKYARARWMPTWKKAWLVEPSQLTADDRIYYYQQQQYDTAYVSQVNLSPFVAVSVLQDELFLARRDSAWAFGWQAGLEFRYEQDLIAMGLEAHVGENLSDGLLVLPEVADHLNWGTTAFLYFGL